jgi:hypothetical protein
MYVCIKKKAAMIYLKILTYQNFGAPDEPQVTESVESRNFG